MFYDVFERQCHKEGTSPFACCKAIGLNGGTAAYWKKSGGIPKRETLEKIAEHLNCTVDYLLGRETKTPPELLTLRATRDEWAEILNSMTDENLIRLRDYAELLLLQQAQAEQECQESRE